MLLLKQGRYKEAWKLFDGRLKLNAFHEKNINIDNINKKLSNNKEFIREDKILVVREQGIGDEILYASMYADMLKKYPNTYFESDKRLITLFERSLNTKSENIFFPLAPFRKKKKIYLILIVLFSQEVWANYSETILEILQEKVF